MSNVVCKRPGFKCPPHYFACYWPMTTAVHRKQRDKKLRNGYININFTYLNPWCVCNIEFIVMANTSYKYNNQKSYNKHIINVSLHLNKQYHRANSAYDILLASLHVFRNVLAPH